MKPFRLLLLLYAVMSRLSGCGLIHSNERMAFMGDSLIQSWAMPRVNLGIHGQTTAQMLERFPRQVPGHGYSTVFILGGTDDVLLHVDLQTTVANLGHMVDIAEAAKIEPVLAEIPPIYRDNGTFLPAVQSLNEQIVHLAETRHLKLVNYYGAIAGHPKFESDGVHIRSSGYLMMEIALVRTKNPF